MNPADDLRLLATRIRAEAQLAARPGQMDRLEAFADALERLAAALPSPRG